MSPDVIVMLMDLLDQTRFSGADPNLLAQVSLLTRARGELTLLLSPPPDAPEPAAPEATE